MFFFICAGSSFVQPISILLLHRVLHFPSTPTAGDHGDGRQKISMATAVGYISTKVVAVMTLTLTAVTAVMAAVAEVQWDD